MSCVLNRTGRGGAGRGRGLVLLHNTIDYALPLLPLLKINTLPRPCLLHLKFREQYLTTVCLVCGGGDRKQFPLLPAPDRLLIENVIHCCHVTGQLANGNLNFKRNMNKILFYFENELCALHHESNICLNLLCS